MAKQAPATKADKLNSLYKECGLIKEDVFQHQHYTILTRSGIEKVQAHYGIQVSYKALKLEPKYAVIKAVAKMDEATVETYGSAVPENCKNSYFAETAEKRALSRAVLKLTGLYQHGFFGEEESEQLTADAKAAPQKPAEPDILTDALNRLRNGDAPGAVWKAYTELHANEDFKAAVKAESERRKAAAV
ncbi:hypothetical protein [Hymenobacter sp. UYP22]|jgi:hypothetical protein|uniref:hypothetical protein n=1 Tax=Hymenobacter sp. UYP22 TaxID=3156348 RepID=UPI0033908AF7